MNSYIVRNSDGIYTVYFENNCIYTRKFVAESWSEPKAIASDAYKNFSLIRSCEGEPLILYFDKCKNLFIGSSDKPHKMVLRASSEMQSTLQIDGILNGSSLRLFYSRQTLGEKYITEQHRREDGSWSAPLTLDTYIPENNLTKIINIENNYILFYSKKVPEQQIGYREISSNNISEFKLIYSSGYKINDYSLAVTEDEIHIAAVVSTFRTNKLIYVKKNSSGISKANTLYEGPVKLCHISIQNSKIIIVFSTPKGNSRIISFDMGASFKRAENTEAFVLSKAEFTDYTKQVADNFVASELITDTGIAYKVKMCPFIKDYENNEIERLKKEIERLKKR